MMLKQRKLNAMQNRHYVTQIIASLALCLLSGCAYDSTVQLQSNTPIRPNSQSIDKAEAESYEKGKYLLEEDLAIFSRVTKKDGWDVPCLAISRTEIPVETYLSKTISPKINLTELKLSQEVTTYIYTYFLEQSENLIVHPNKVRVGKIERFAVGNRAFCYIVYGNYVETDGKTKAEVSMGKMSTFVYYDDNGDGLFEVFDSGPPTFEPRIPKWVLNDKD